MSGYAWQNVTRALVAHMEGRGFRPVRVDYGFDDGSDEIATDADTVVQAVGATDFSFIHFAHSEDPKPREYRVLMIPENGEDVLSDWGVPKIDPRGFDAAMTAFVIR